jgi:hypothetical protein
MSPLPAVQYVLPTEPLSWPDRQVDAEVSALLTAVVRQGCDGPEGSHSQPKAKASGFVAAAPVLVKPVF